MPVMNRKIAVITGGSAGVGRAIVREFAAHGYDVAVLARGQEGVDAAVRDAERAGARALGIPTDVSVLAEVEAAAAQVEQELGPIDVWVNDAFVGALRFFWDTDDSLYRRTIRRLDETESGAHLAERIARLVGPDAPATLEWLRRAPLDGGVAAELVSDEGEPLGNGGDAALSALLAHTAWFAANAFGVGVR